MVRAVVYRVDTRTLGPELIAHPRRKRLELLFAVVTLGDAGLIGDDHDQPSRFVGRAHEFEDAGNELEILDPVHMAVIDVDDAVAIQEKGGLFHFAVPSAIQAGISVCARV